MKKLRSVIERQLKPGAAPVQQPSPRTGALDVVGTLLGGGAPPGDGPIANAPPPIGPVVPNPLLAGHLHSPQDADVLRVIIFFAFKKLNNFLNQRISNFSIISNVAYSFSTIPDIAYSSVRFNDQKSKWF